MKIIDILTSEQKSSINELIKKYDKNSEFEVSLFSTKETSSNLLTLEKFNNLNSILTIVTAKNEEKYKFIKSNNLDIIMSIKDNIIDTKKITNYRITIDKLEKINEYLEMLHMRKNHLVFSVLTSFFCDKNLDRKDLNHIKIIKKTKNIIDYVLLEEIYMKFKLDYEEELEENELKKLTKINKNFDLNTYQIIYRFKERSSYFIIKEKNIFRIDLTMVKTSYQINKIETTPYSYEIEIECEIKDKTNFLKNYFDVAEFIIKSVQGSNYIITKSLSEKILENYRELVGVDISKKNLYARQPVSLEVQNLVDALPNKYALSDKADGDRYYLIVYDGRCFLISTNLIVIDTGIEVDKSLNNSLLDGEYIFIPKYNTYLYMCFDCIFYGKIHVGNESKIIKRHEYADMLIENINKIKVKKKDLKLDYNNIDKLIEYHKNNLIEFYKDIDEELKNKSVKILFRRKYFMDVHGIYDNEIFKYTNFMWNLYTINKDFKCPYFLDGLIFHPLDQKYIIDLDKSKYSEYKWKPPNKNSIDFYIEFEKDKNTGKIITAYDNSIPDVVKNKPYQIANLFVGLNIKGVEKPVIFGQDKGISQAYIYIDEKNIPRSIDGKQINDKTVVEFYYNLDNDCMNQYKWIPIKTRFDKTESVIKYGKKYGNAERTAYAIWRSIVNPILISDFINLSDDINYNKYFKILQNKIDFDVIKLEKKQNIYFQKKSDLVKDMGKFHNWIKSNLIYTYMNYKYNDDIQCKVLDIACGRGGDIQKFYYAEVELYVGFDTDIDALIDSTDGAISRYKNEKKKHDRYPPMYFIQADAGNLLQYDEQIKKLGKMNTDNKKLFEKFFTWDNKRIIYDRLNCQFAIHYFLSDENTWNNFTENINMYLREGGYFIFTTFDGNKVKEKLLNQDKYIEYYDDNGEKKVLFEIVKKYDDNSKNSLGNAIDVHMGWIFEPGVYQTEYLVYPEYIIKSLIEKCSLELVETDTIENVFYSHKEFLKIASEVEEQVKRRKFFKDVYKYYTKSDINLKCHEYSFLSRFYIFRKKESNLSEIKKKYYGYDRKRIADKKI